MDIDFSKYYLPKSKQLQAHQCHVKYILYGGSMGSGKSWWLCAEAIKHLMKFAGGRAVIVRRELSTIKRTILVTFFQICPPLIIRNFNKSSLTVELINGSTLSFISADQGSDPLLNKLKGLEISFFGIDEANEISYEAYTILKSRLRWVLSTGEIPEYKGRLTSNPEAGWLIPTFIQSNNSDEIYIQALTSDNYSPDSEYYKSLEKAFKDSPLMLRKYLYGDWSVTDSVNQLIPNSAIEACKEKVNGWGSSIGVDVARYGDDRTCFVILINDNIEKIETYAQTSITEVGTRTIQLMEEYKINPENVAIDAVGIGAGVIDYLKLFGFEVQEVIGGAKVEIEETQTPETFKPFNLRSQLYWNLRQAMLSNEIGAITDTSLIYELSCIRYEISSEKTVKILSKDALKKINGRSPDIADAICYAWYGRIYRGVFKGWMSISGGA